MTVGAVSQFHLDRIIRVCGQADLAACVIARMTFKRGTDGKFHEIAYAETRRYRAEKAVARIKLAVASRGGSALKMGGFQTNGGPTHGFQ